MPQYPARNNMFGPLQLSGIKVGWIDPDQGYVHGHSIQEANDEARKNPGTTFIFIDGDHTIRYLNINEVNKLKSEDSVSSTGECGGVNQNVVCGPPRIQIYGGGGIGALGNAVVGTDGTILAVDVVRGGHGYQFPPEVSARDDCDYGSGTVFDVELGEVVDQWQYYDLEEDYEETTISDSSTSYGTKWGPNGENLGEWVPDITVSPEQDPINNEILEYQDILRDVTDPNHWFNTRKNKPNRITAADQKIIASYNEVTDACFKKMHYDAGNPRVIPDGGGQMSAGGTPHFDERTGRYTDGRSGGQMSAGGTPHFDERTGRYSDASLPVQDIGFDGGWGKWMNKFAISPKPASNAPGTDYAGILFTFEWDQLFPLSGEYKIRGACDNRAKLYLDNEYAYTLGVYTGAQLEPPHKINVDEGVHNIRVELLNIPITYKYIDIEGSGGGCPTNEITFNVSTSAHFGNGIKIPELDIDFSKSIGGQQIKEKITKKCIYDHNYDVILSSPETKRGIRLRTVGDRVLQMEEAKDMDWQDLVISASCGKFHSINGNKCKFSIEKPTPPKREVVRDDREVGIQSIKVFDTVDWINKANRKLWRTIVHDRGGFLNERGICPFDTGKKLDDNPYAGKHRIEWDNVKFPADGDYRIRIAVDDNVQLYIGDQVSIRKEGFVNKLDNGWPDNSKPGNHSTGVLDEPYFIKKGTYKIIADLEQIPGGVFRFGGSHEVTTQGGPGSSNISYNGLNSKNKPIRVTDGGKKIKLRDSSGSDTNATFQITSGNGTFASDGKSLNGTGEITLRLVWDDKRNVAGRAVQSIHISGKTWSVSSKEKGSQTHTVNIAPTSSIKGLNPMALAIDIQTSVVVKEIQLPKSWCENPMGIALAIDAPEPSIPQEIPPPQEGRCPPNPIWSTRFPNAEEKWYPVSGKGHSGENIKANMGHIWSKFMTRYALSPIPPLDTPGSAVQGVTHSNTWPLDIPYDGYYAVKGVGDNKGRVLIDEKEVHKLEHFMKENPKASKFFLTKGNHDITVEIWNGIQKKAFTINEKVFGTIDWQAPYIGGVGELCPTTEITFKIGTGSMFGNGIEIKELDINVAKPFTPSHIDGVHQGQKGQLNETLTRTLEYGKDYDVIVTSKDKKRTQTGKKTTIKYIGLNEANDSIRVTGNDKRIELKDSKGSDTNVSFTIDSGKAKFSSDGKSIEGTGKVKISLKYDDNPNYAGEAVRSIQIGNTTWTKERKHHGGETKTVNLGSNNNRTRTGHNIKLRTVGDRVLQTEDYTDMDWTDLVCSASCGKFHSINGNKCKFTIGGLAPLEDVEITKNGVTYKGPKLFHHTEAGAIVNNSEASTPVRWASYMQMHSVSPMFPDLYVDNPNIEGVKVYTWTNVDFPESGTYSIKFAADNNASVFIDDQLMTGSHDHLLRMDYGYWKQGKWTNVQIPKGKHTIRVECLNLSHAGDRIFINNPVGFALLIKLQRTIFRTDMTSWEENPVAASAILIGPPCPKPIGGKGVVEKIIPREPGNGYPQPPPDSPGYKTLLTIDKILVDKPGINYNCGEDTITINPDNGAKLEPVCGPYGSIKEVKVVDPGAGFTVRPSVQIVSKTGAQAKFITTFKIIRDPLDVPPEDLIQVTDLVGLKQTGYYDGRAYYGAVFYQDGIRYAGYYKTAGQLTQIYDTMQESIDAQVTTRPSAIQRSGTDITSNDPRLNIPGTPDNLT